MGEETNQGESGTSEEQSLVETLSLGSPATSDDSTVENSIESFDNNLPKTVTLLLGPNGSKLYLIGTAHFSKESQDDVSLVIRNVKPHIVVVELCKSRAHILQMDEETIEKEAKNLTFEKVKSIINENGILQGVMYVLLLKLSATLTRDLGMAPGGEFRRAFSEAQKIGCMLHFGDRPIQVTLKRALGSLTWWQGIRLACSLIFSNHKISREEIEKFKESDLLASMLEEMTGDFPGLGKVFVDERDIYLTYSLQTATSFNFSSYGEQGPTVAVGIVGIGHTRGIKEKWGTVKEEDIPPIMKINAPSRRSKIIKRTLFYGTLVLIGFSIGRKYSNKLPNLNLSTRLSSVFSKLVR